MSSVFWALNVLKIVSFGCLMFRQALQKFVFGWGDCYMGWVITTVASGNVRTMEQQDILDLTQTHWLAEILAKSCIDSSIVRGYNLIFDRRMIHDE